jgi:hypothetical protein
VTAGGFHVETDSLREVGAHLSRLAEQMVAGLDDLHATVTGSGNPWGGDEQGTIFAQLYGAVLTKAIEALDSQVQQVAYAGAGLTRQAETYEQTEAANTTAFDDVRARLGD